jgi:hypothetical protein
MKRALSFWIALAALPSSARAANLIVANIWDHSPVIVYDLPGAAGRADAIRYVESVRDRYKKEAKVLDAGANPAGLRAALRHGFILYTTLEDKSSLLRMATRKLEWNIAGATFHWRSVTAPAGDDLRFILVGRNPYSKGYCVIYAAASNRALVGINDVRQGAASYHLYQGSRLLKEGLYDRTFVPVERLSRIAALDDVNQFFATLPRVHPDLFGKVSPQLYRELKQQTVNGVEARLDSNGEIPVEDLAYLLYYAGAYFHDGHTSVRWQTRLNEVNTRGKRFPAFRLAFDNGRFLIAAAVDRTLVDSELVAVNGAPAMDFLRPVLDRSSGETLGFRVACFLEEEPFWYYLTNLFGAGTPYRLKLRDAQGRDREVDLVTLNYPEYRAFREQEGGEPYWPNRQGTRVEFFDSGATAHFLYSAFEFSPEQKKQIDHVFEEVKAKGARNLIIDLRDNGGGMSTMAEYIFRYLYAGKYYSFRKIRFKASWETLSSVPWWARPVDFVLRGHVIPHTNPPVSGPRPDAFFTGRVYLLVNNGTFSMASSFATMVRDYGVGTILGYETGGMPVTYGGPYRFTLKNSRIPCVVAWTQNFPPMAFPGDEDHGVIPDVPLSAQSLARFKTERDPALAFALQYVRTAHL